MSKLPPSMQNLINELGRLPGIGGKTATRLAFHLMGQEEEKAIALAEAIKDAVSKISLCQSCCNLSETDPCPICSDISRDLSSICVVESPKDLQALERTGEYHGLYHVLHGVINPIKSIGPDKIKLRELLSRLQETPEISEVFIAINPSVEGEATALYIARLLKPSGIKTTRLAHGIPMGSDLEYADDVTLAKAISNRQEI